MITIHRLCVLVSLTALAACQQHSSDRAGNPRMPEEQETSAEAFNPPKDPAAREAWMAERLKRREGNLKPADEAPDFEIKVLKSEQTVRLSSYRGVKPVALVFGSYT